MDAEDQLLLSEGVYRQLEYHPKMEVEKSPHIQEANQGTWCASEVGRVSLSAPQAECNGQS